MKIGRNDPCPCGSGKKYKKCHLLTNGFSNPRLTQIASTSELESMRQGIEGEQSDRRKISEQLGIFIDFVVPVNFQGKKVWALGSRLYYDRPENETFHEFITYVLQQELGQKWWDEQSQLPETDRHFIFQCFRKHNEWKSKNMLPENRENGRWRAKPDGYSRALISLAFDVCSLLHAVHLPEIFLNKLRTYDDYQSVRYEIAVAALFARMSYKIKFLDEEVLGQKNQPKHPEFIATDPNTSEEIAVEVKSKERKGALHKEGVLNEQKEFRSSITKLYRHALEQKLPNLPFIVFIDMNLPLSPGVRPEDNLWVQAIIKMRDSAAFATKGQNSPTYAIVFTNYSHHYGTDQETGSGEWLLEMSGNPEFPVKSDDFNHKFAAVLGNYGKVPNIDMKIDT